MVFVPLFAHRRKGTAGPSRNGGPPYRSGPGRGDRSIRHLERRGHRVRKMLTTLAARYARALADVVREPASLEKTAGELEGFASLMGGSKALRDRVLIPAFP